MTTKDRGTNARKTVAVLVNDREKRELQKALDEENAERGLDLGLGSKLRELGLLWARNRKDRSEIQRDELERIAGHGLAMLSRP